MMTHQQRLERAREYFRRQSASTIDRAELEELRAKLDASTETMRTIANLFSASIWRLLPARIKEHFEEYREG